MKMREGMSDVVSNFVAPLTSNEKQAKKKSFKPKVQLDMPPAGKIRPKNAESMRANDVIAAARQQLHRAA